MGGRIGILAGMSMAAAALQAAPAQAQYMPHLDPNLYILATMNYGAGANPCMAGTPMADAEIAEARAPSLTAMQAYFRAAQSGEPKSAAFHLDKKSKWQGGGVTAGQLEIDSQVDPLAVPGNVLEAEPLRFYRGGAGATALGQWAVLDAAGEVAGVYTVSFARAKKAWKLRELTLSRAGETVEPAAQYCVKPGDVMEHRLSSTNSWRENAQKSADEARAELASATAAVTQAQAAAAADPGNRGHARALAEAERDKAKWAKRLADREENLGKSLEESAEVARDAEEIRRLTGEARFARAFRIAPEVEQAAD